jgi:hypothetical protein
MKAPVEKKVWFPAKRYGWGWGPPNCWQGWVVMLLWLALVFASTFLLNQHLAWAVVCMGGLVLLLILICYLKGEKPRWRWGKD